MGDIICVRCGEPWESYGITYARGDGDLTLDEVKKFIEGAGCPACGFGTICPKCLGGKIEKNNCPTCFGSGYVFAKRCPSAAVEILHEEKPEESLDGIVYVVKVKCPDCHGEGEPCSECGGDATFHAERQPDYFDQAVGSLLDNSDAEPIGVLTRFMRGAQTMQNSTEPGATR